MPAWLGIVLVLAALAAILGGLRGVQVRYDLDSESARKGVHVLMGGVTLTFPWLFDAAWPVVVMGGCAVLGLLLLRTVPVLRERVGSVLHSVGRPSYGEIYYAVAVVLLFLLSRGDPVLYGVPILLLGLADPVAALVGLRYGQSLYRTSEGVKSGEGSASFFLVAFFCVHIPVLLATDTGRLESLLVAVIAGLLLMLLEAIAWRGLDNLFVPIGGYALLRTHLQMEAYELGARLVVIAALFTLASIWHRETTLDRSATFTAALVGVVAWLIGGWTWLLAPAALYFGYTLLWPSSARVQKSDAGPPTLHTVQNVLSVASVGFGWLFLSVAEHGVSMVYPYTLAYAGYLALIGAERLRSYPHPFSSARMLGSSSLKSIGALLVPLALAEGLGAHLLPLAGGLVGSVLFTVAVYLSRPHFFDDAPTTFFTHVRRALLVTAGSALGLPVLLLSEGLRPSQPWPLA
jgi:phytol kinase